MWKLLCDYSVVPTLVVEAGSLTVLAANASARTMLDRQGEYVGEAVFDVLSSTGDNDALSRAVRECALTNDVTRFLTHRIVRPGAPDMPLEVAVVAASSDEAGDRHVLVQMRDISRFTPLALLIRLLADNPDGDSLLRAVVDGPFAGTPVRAATMSIADLEHRNLFQVGAVGLDLDLQQAFRVTPLSHALPEGATVLNVETVWMSMIDLVRRFPVIENLVSLVKYFETGEIMSLPVTSRGRVIGTLFLVADEPMPRSWSFHETAVSVAQALAPWMLMRRSETDVESTSIPKTSPLAISERERGVIRLVDEGKTNAEIGTELGYSEATVRADLSRVGRMLGVRGRRAIAHRVAELDL